MRRGKDTAATDPPCTCGECPDCGQRRRQSIRETYTRESRPFTDPVWNTRPQARQNSATGSGRYGLDNPD